MIIMVIFFKVCQIINSSPLSSSSSSSSLCPDDFSYHENSQKCFTVEKWSDKSVNQMDARLTCAKKNNAFLACIGSEDENDFIKNLLVRKDAMIAYIGLQSLSYDVSRRYWCDGTTLEYMRWMNEKPDNGDFKDDGCVVIDTNGYWDDWTCDRNEDIGPRATVCQIKIKHHNNDDNDDNQIKHDDEAIVCSEDFEYCPSTKNCYKVITSQEPMNQTIAQAECDKYNAHLASIDSNEENQFVSDLAMKNPLSSMRVYIGLESDKTDTDASKRHWIDGTSVTYLNWEHTKPDDEPYDDNNCVVLIPERNGVWDDWACADSCCLNHAVYGAVCEIDQ
ncbi:Macrophage mannose receptor [Dirofilaria immitis]